LFHDNCICILYYICYFYKITGTGHGIGKELAIQYACLGAKVVCLDKNKQTNEETVEMIKEIGREAYAYRYVTVIICIILSCFCIPKKVLLF